MIINDQRDFILNKIYYPWAKYATI